MIDDNSKTISRKLVQDAKLKYQGGRKCAKGVILPIRKEEGENIVDVNTGK
jgi:hypothetical protein